MFLMEIRALVNTGDVLERSLELRSEHEFPKPLPSPITLLALSQHREISNSTDLKEMLDMGDDHCQIKSLLEPQRIFLKYDGFPSVYTGASGLLRLT